MGSEMCIRDRFKSVNCKVDVYDPWINKEESIAEYGFKPIDFPFNDKYDGIVLAVGHDEFKSFSLEKIKSFGKGNHVIYDVKYLLRVNESDGRL